MAGWCEKKKGIQVKWDRIYLEISDGFLEMRTGESRFATWLERSHADEIAAY